MRDAFSVSAVEILGDLEVKKNKTFVISARWANGRTKSSLFKNGRISPNKRGKINESAQNKTHFPKMFKKIGRF